MSAQFQSLSSNAPAPPTAFRLSEEEEDVDDFVGGGQPSSHNGAMKPHQLSTSINNNTNTNTNTNNNDYERLIGGGNNRLTAKQSQGGPLMDTLDEPISTTLVRFYLIYYH